MAQKKQNSIYAKILSKIGKVFNKTDFNDDNVLGENIRIIMFVLFLTLIYIANTHYAERNMRETIVLQKELKELRWEYMTTKSELMFKSKQTEVAKLVRSQNLKELRNPPFKITVKE